MTSIPPSPPPAIPLQSQGATTPAATATVQPTPPSPQADTAPAPSPVTTPPPQQQAQQTQAPQQQAASSTPPAPQVPLAAPTPPPPQATLAPTLVDALVVQAPPTAAIQPAPVTLPAIVSDVQTDGITRLLTTIGDFDVQTAAPLQVGQKLAIPLPAGPLPDILYLKFSSPITQPAAFPASHGNTDPDNPAFLNPKGLLQTVRTQIENIIQKITPTALTAISAPTSIPVVSSPVGLTAQLRLWTGQVLQSAPTIPLPNALSTPASTPQTLNVPNAVKTTIPAASPPLQTAPDNNIITVILDKKIVQFTQKLTEGLGLPLLPKASSVQNQTTQPLQQAFTIQAPQTIKVTGIAPTFMPHTMQATPLQGVNQQPAQLPTSLPTQAPVVGFTPDGYPVLGFLTDDGIAGQRPLLFVVTSPVQVKTGQWVHFETSGTQLLRLGATTPALQTQNINPPMAESTWPLLSALDDLFADNMNSDLPGTQTPLLQLLQQTMPRPGAMLLTPPMLLLLSALKGGDIQAWLGEQGLETLKSHTKNAALARLKSGFEAAATQRKNEPDTPANEWKSVTLPLLTGYELSRILLHTRSFAQNEQENGKDQPKSTRFVMDLHFSRIGPMQLEGFVTARQLDVTVRSERDFSATMREALRARYTQSVEAVGYAGRLHFHASADHKGWLKI